MKKVGNQKEDRKTKRRRGIVAKTRSSKHKGSKNYKKRYRGQGRVR